MFSGCADLGQGKNMFLASGLAGKFIVAATPVKTGKDFPKQPSVVAQPGMPALGDRKRQTSVTWR